MGVCCRKLFLCLTYPSFSNVVSAEVGVARGSMLPQINFYFHIFPSFYTVSFEVGVAWGIFHDIIVYIFI